MKRHVFCALLNAPWVYRNHMGATFLRIAVGAMMLVHGVPKFAMLLRGEGADWMDPIGIGGTLSLALCCFAEFGCSLALVFGLFTRLAALVLAINFWVVVFFVDSGASWAQRELPLLYLVCYITLICAGAGRFSLDHLLSRMLGCRYEEAPPLCSRCKGALSCMRSGVGSGCTSCGR